MFNKNSDWLFLTLLVLIHCLFLTFPPVNQEFAFLGASQFFTIHNQELLDQFFTYQANTLGLPYFTYLLSNAFPHIDTLTLFRLVNVSGVILLIAGLQNITRLLNHPETNKILWLVTLNPLVWTFSERATADFIPAALAIFAISLAPGKTKTLAHAGLTGVLLGLAAIFKYHALSLLVLLATLLLIADRTQAIKKTMMAGVLSVGMVMLYALSVHHIFGFWLTPDRYQTIHHVNLSGIANNLILYTGFLGLIALPTLFLSEKVWKVFFTHWKSLTIGFVLLLALGLSVITDSGELNLGPLDAFLAKDLRVVILCLMCLATVALTYTFNHEEDHKAKRYIGIAILITLIAFSSSRPAQRYLLFVIPFFVLLLPKQVFKSKVVYLSSLMFFIIANSFIELSRYATGNAAQAMVEALNQKHLLEVTLPADIESHVGDAFFSSRNHAKQYLVVAGKNNAAIATTSGGVFFYKKYFSLTEINTLSQNSFN